MVSLNKIFNTGIYIDGDLILNAYPLLTRKQLKDFCIDKDITKELFEEMSLNLVLGADLLTELISVNETHHPYVNHLLRIEKFKRLTK